MSPPLSRPSFSYSSLLLQCLSRPGPSRLASRLSPCSHCIRSASTSTSSSSTDPVEAGLHSSLPQGGGQAEMGASGRGKKGKKDVTSYKDWFATEAQQYRYPPDKGPNWLGGSVPYPTNPSFRPPTPLSDALREIIYQEHFYPSTAISRNLTEMSLYYGVSKARIQAILKLKSIEKGWEKEGKTLQIPFQQSMERYLGVQPPSSRWTMSQDADTRRRHPFFSAEASEEASHNDYVSTHSTDTTASTSSSSNGNSQQSSSTGGLDMSAFAKRDTIIRDNGVERGVWEFRGEEFDSVESLPGGEQEMDVPYNRVFSDEQKASFEKRKEGRRVIEEKERERASGVVDLGKDGGGKETFKPKSNKTIYRFVDLKKSTDGHRTDLEFSLKGMGKRQDRATATLEGLSYNRRKENKKRRKEKALLLESEETKTREV